MEVLHVNHVSRRFGKHEVLKDINLTIEPNKIYGLLGRNGAGKSTLLNIITNRIFTSDGTVTLGNENVAENDFALTNMYLMSEVNLYTERLKVRKIFKLVELSYGKFDWPLAYDLANQFQVDLDVKFGGLSTGYHSIVKLIIALCVPANFIFLDEPVLGLDANHRELFYQELLTAYEKRPRTFLISTHLIEEIANMVEHVFIMDQGIIIEDEDVEDLVAKAYSVTGPRQSVTEYTQGLNVIGQESLGQITSNYVFGSLNDRRVIPDSVTIEHIDLQKLFVYLTNGGSNHDQREE